MICLYYLNKVKSGTCRLSIACRNQWSVKLQHQTARIIAQKGANVPATFTEHFYNDWIKGKDYSLCYRLIFLTLLCRLDLIFCFSHHVKFTLIKNSSYNKKKIKKWHNSPLCYQHFFFNKEYFSASAGQKQHSISHRWPQIDWQTHFLSLAILVTHTDAGTKTHTHTLHSKDYWDMVLFWEGCRQQRLICEALLYPNLVSNASAFRSF